MAITELEFIVEPSDTQVNRTILPAITVALKDETGAVVSTATDQVTIAIEDNPSGGVLSGTTTRRAVAGVAVFNNLKIDQPGVDYTLRASSDVNDPCTSLSGIPTTGLQFDHSGGCVSGEDGADLLFWPDSFSSENDLTNIVTSTCPNVAAAFLNGLSVVQYGGNELPSTFRLDRSLPVSVFTYVSVMRCTADTSLVPRTLLGEDWFEGGAPEIRIFDGKISLAKQGVVVIGSSETTIDSDNFHTVAVTYDGTTARFFLDDSPDGVTVNAQEFTRPIRNQGAGAPNQNFIGYIAEDLLWNVVLDPEEQLPAVFAALRARWAHLP
jgi:hypothetical protein